MEIDFIAIHPTSGFQLVPSHSIVLNPDQERRRRFAYFAFFHDPEVTDRLTTLDETIRGEGYGNLYVYYTDYVDLVAMGRRDMDIPEEYFESLFEDWSDLCGLMAREWKKSPLAGKPWCFAYMLVDMMARSVPVGVTEGGFRNGGGSE